MQQTKVRNGPIDASRTIAGLYRVEWIIALNCVWQQKDKEFSFSINLEPVDGRTQTSKMGLNAAASKTGEQWEEEKN